MTHNSKIFIAMIPNAGLLSIEARLGYYRGDYEGTSKNPRHQANFMEEGNFGVPCESGRADVFHRQSPNPMPMARAARTISPSGLTDLRWPIAWATSTETIEPPCRATILPKPPAAITSTAATPKRVARMRSKSEGVPPR